MCPVGTSIPLNQIEINDSTQVSTKQPPNYESKYDLALQIVIYVAIGFGALLCISVLTIIFVSKVRRIIRIFDVYVDFHNYIFY
jgi:hypothetical protein